MESVMSNKLSSQIDSSQPMTYQIEIQGHLDLRWTDWFGGVTITLEENGNTFLTSPVIDQSALYGLIKKVRDLAMPLVSVVRVKPVEADGLDDKQ
jgi:hypothetical protein